MRPGPSETPRSLADRAAGAAIDAACGAAPVKRMVVMIQLEDPPPIGEPNGTTSGHGFDNAAETWRWSLDHLKFMADAIGEDMVILPCHPQRN